MEEEIRQTKTLTDEETQQLFGWGENIFGVQSFKLSWRPKDLHFLLYSQGKLVSHVGVLRHEVSVAGEPVIVGGVAGVVTIPEARGRGFAMRLMKCAAELFERKWKVDAGLLFCLTRLEPYYQTLGWQRLTGPVIIEQPDGKIASPLSVMVLPLGRISWSNRTVELQSLPW